MTTPTNKEFAKGFIKAAAAKNMTIDDFAKLVKYAFANSDSLTMEDVDRIKAELTNHGVNPPYEDNSGELSRLYNAKLLHERDNRANAIPEVEGLTHGIAHGAIGAAVGGATGAGLGHLVHKSKILNMDHGITKHFPVGFGVTAATLAGVLSALPHAKQKYEAAKAFKKLHNIDNLQSVADNNTMDRNLLNS